MFLFLHYRSVFEICQSNLLPQKLRNVHSAQVTQEGGGNKLRAKIFYCNSLFFVCRLEGDNAEYGWRQFGEDCVLVLLDPKQSLSRYIFSNFVQVNKVFVNCMQKQQLMVLSCGISL
jgi:hypothetical protein